MAELNGWIDSSGIQIAAFPVSIRGGFSDPETAKRTVQPTALPGLPDAEGGIAHYPLHTYEMVLDAAGMGYVVGGVEIPGISVDGTKFAQHPTHTYGALLDAAALDLFRGVTNLPGLRDVDVQFAAHHVHTHEGFMDLSADIILQPTALPAFIINEELFGVAYRGQDFRWPRRAPLDWIYKAR